MKILKFTILFLVLCTIFFLIGCVDNNRIEELEQRVTNLQDELAEKEKTIAELQQTTKEDVQIKEEDVLEKNDTDKNNEKAAESTIIEVINGYIDAVEKQNFIEQRKYVAKYVKDLVDLKEDEYKKSSLPIKRTVEKQLPKVLNVGDNRAEAFISFTENIETYDGSEYSLITEGKVYLEKIDSHWKIIDYTRKNRLISEALYVFEEDTIESIKNNIEIELRRVLFSIFDKYVVVNFKLINNNNEPLNISASSSAVIGPNRIQHSYIFMDEVFANEILANAAVIGDIQLNWDNDTVSDFEFYSGYFYDKDGYKFCDSLSFLVELEKAIRH
jgi:outer membrane murein-binding lipoprotein Lpp